MSCTTAHISVGAAYIDVGSPFEATSVCSLFASEVGVKAVGGYMVVGGILMILLPLFVCYNLAKNKTNRALATVSWVATCIIGMIMFTCGVLAAQMYTPTNQRIKDLGLSLSDYGSHDNIKEQKPEIPSDLLSLIPLCHSFWDG